MANPTQCPCGLSREEVRVYEKIDLNTMCCTAPRRDDRTVQCEMPLQHHPYEAQLTSLQAQGERCHYFISPFATTDNYYLSFLVSFFLSVSNADSMAMLIAPRRSQNI